MDNQGEQGEQGAGLGDENAGPQRPRRAAAAMANQAWMPAQRGRGRGRRRGVVPLPPPNQLEEDLKEEAQWLPPGGQIEQQLQDLQLGQNGGQQIPNQPIQGGQQGIGLQLNPGADAAFVAVLANFLFSLQAINAIIANGVISVNSLVGLTSKDIENIMTIVRKSTPPVVVNYVSQKRLTILAYWANRKHRLAEEINLAAFAEQEAYGNMMNSEPDRETMVKEPPEFKGNIKWKPWKESVISYFNSSLTKDFIPLSYIIRENDDPIPGAIYESEHQRLVAIAPLRGTEFKHDNGVVFDFLKTWTINGPAYPWMKQFSTTRNGRAAWMALLAYYEGSAARDRVKEAAYAAIANAKYHGEKKKFSFETYVNIHQEAYQDLRQNDEIIPEDKRVRDLLTGIKDTSLNAAKQTIMAMPTLRADFAATVAHLATSLQMNAALLPDVRNISSAITTTGRGDGRGNNRGRGRGRGGKRRGGGGRNIYLGNYNAAQWRALSAEDKKKVREGRKRSVEQQSQTPTTINVSQVTTTEPDAQSTIMTPTAVITRVDTENAGSAMTRRRINAITTGARGNRTGNRMISQVHLKEDEKVCFST